MCRQRPRSTLFPYTTLFRSALSRNCSCVVTAEGVRLSTCAPHEMLSSDQRAIDGLLFARRIAAQLRTDRKSTRLNSSHTVISYAVFCLKKKIPTLCTVLWPE